MTDKKQTISKHAPIHSIRVGDVVADIHTRTTNSGFCYMDFSLERTFASSTGRQSRGATFFATTEPDLIEATHQAAAWIRAKANAASITDTPGEASSDNH